MNVLLESSLQHEQASTNSVRDVSTTRCRAIDETHTVRQIRDLGRLASTPKYYHLVTARYSQCTNEGGPENRAAVRLKETQT